MELRVIEKPVVHPDRRFISLVHARQYTGASLLLSRPSTYSHLSRRLLLALSPSARRNKKDEKKPGREKRGAERRADARRGKPGRREETGDGRRGEEEKRRWYATMPAEVHSRAITDARRGGAPLTNGFVNHGRFKVITHRKKES